MTPKALVSRRVADSLGRSIVTGEIAMGSSLPSEADLCTRYDASRTAVREALKILDGKQLITARPRVGGTVSDRSRWSLLDADVLRWMKDAPPDIGLLRELARLRLAIEPEAAAAAARWGDPAAIAALDAATAAMADDPQQALAADVAFHVALLRGSGNRFFQALGNMVESALSMSIPVTNAAKQVPKADVDAHRVIFEAIRDGDEEEARAGAHALITETIRLLDQAPESP